MRSGGLVESARKHKKLRFPDIANSRIYFKLAGKDLFVVIKGKLIIARWQIEYEK